MSHKLNSVVIVHQTKEMRYSPDDTIPRQNALTAALDEGAGKIQAWTWEKHSVKLIRNNKFYTTP
jgi:hypothetical protein